MYKIIKNHARPWTSMQEIVFVVLLIFLTTIMFREVRAKKISFSQAIATELLFVFCVLVIGTTVFTRTSTGVRHYKLYPFWSWKEAIRGNKALLEEIFLNVLLLVPAGFLIPFVYCKKFPVYKAFLLGFFFSFFIELCQLMFCLGLFEWDDMIGNGLGSMIGCILANRIQELIKNGKHYE